MSEKCAKGIGGNACRLTKHRIVSKNENAKLDNVTIMIVAGLVSIADWICSDTEYFECEEKNFDYIPNLDLTDYLQQAEKALIEFG